MARSARGFTRIGDTAPDGLGLPPARVRELRLAAAWRAVAGDNLAARALATRIRSGVLTVEVRDERWAAQLAGLLPRLAARLAARHPELGVHRFRIASAERRGAARPLPETGDGLEPAPPPAPEATPGDGRAGAESVGIEEVARAYLTRGAACGPGDQNQ